MQGQLAKGQAVTKGQVATGDPVANHTNDLLSHLTPATNVGRGNIARHRTARLWMLLAEGVAKRGHYKKVCLQGKHSAHSLETPQMTLAGAGASEPLYFNDEGQPVYAYMVSVPHANKHLIRFPITLEPMSLRRKGHTCRFFSSYTFCIAQGRYRSRCQPDQQEDLRSTL